MPAPVDRHRPGSRAYRRLNLAMLGAGLAAFGMLYATQPVLPEIADAFGASATQVSLTVSASTGALALAVVPVTALALRFGRVRTMRIGLLVAAALALACAVAPSLAVLIVLRGLLGVVLAGVIAVAMGHVGAEVHPSGLASAMGLYVAGNSLGGVGGRLITAAVVDLGSWRWALAGLALAALAATAAFWWLLPPALNETTSGRDVPGTPGPVGLAGFGVLLRNPAVLALIAIPFLLMGGFVAVYNFMTFRLVAPPFSLPVTVVGLVFLAYLAGTLTSAVAGRAAGRFGRARVLVGGTAVMLGGLLTTLSGRLPLVVIGVVVMTAGFFAAHAVASGWAPVVGEGFTTQASALYVCAYYAGSSLFGAVIGVAWDAWAWPGVVAWVATLIVLAAVAAGVVARRTPPG